MAKASLPRTSRSKRQGSSPARPDLAPGHKQVIWAPPVEVPLAGSPDPSAVSVFERAMAALQRHDYQKALTQFEELLQRFAESGALIDRARVYGALCRRELARSQGDAPTTTEERLTAATAALNSGEDQLAEQLVTRVLREAPGRELGHYLLAVVHARRGAITAALDALGRAIAVSPEVRAQARHDADFEPLRGNEIFDRLIADTPAHSGTRRGSRPRSDR